MKFPLAASKKEDLPAGKLNWSPPEENVKSQHAHCGQIHLGNDQPGVRNRALGKLKL